MSDHVTAKARIPSYWMQDERNAYMRGWRDGLRGKAIGKSRQPMAYALGYRSGVEDMRADLAAAQAEASE